MKAPADRRVAERDHERGTAADIGSQKHGCVRLAGADLVGDDEKVVG